VEGRGGGRKAEEGMEAGIRPILTAERNKEKNKTLFLHLFFYLIAMYSPEKISHQISLWNFNSEHEIKQEKHSLYNQT